MTLRSTGGQEVKMEVVDREKPAKTNGAARADSQITTTKVKRRKYAARYIAATQKSVAGFVEQGQVICEANDDLPHGDFLAWLEEDLGFKNPRKPQMLMQIARHSVISNAKYFSLLPPCWSTLHKLTEIPLGPLKQMLADGRIHREMDYKDAVQLTKPFKKSSLLGSLIAKLETVEPAIANNPLIPLLQHYWFTGKHLLANNGIICIQVPFVSDFAGAVPSGLLDLLKAAAFSGEIRLEAENDHLLVVSDPRNGGARIKLKMLEPTFPFKMPQHKQTNSNPQAIAELVEAIRYCMISVGTDVSIPECLGITLERDGKRIIMLHSFDGFIISRTSISGQLPLAKRTTLPSSFCRQMMRLYDNRGENSEVAFEIGERERERYALFTAGDVKLYGHIIESGRIPHDFGIVAWHLPNDYQKRLVDIPERLRKAVALASKVCDERRRQTRITVHAGQLSLLSKDQGIEVAEVMSLASTHADVTVVLEPKQLRHISNFDKMLVTTKCIILTKATGNELHLVSCAPPRQRD
jgi:hypothetical protein